VNHGKINYKIYGKADKDTVKKNNPILRIAGIYFAAYRHRSTHMVAMKYHTAKLANGVRYNLREIAELINVTNHSSVNHLLKHYVPLPDHDKFIEEHYMEFITVMLYPVRSKSYDDEEQYTLIHISKIKVNEERQQAPKPKVIPKEWPKFH
jgi:hypothetical protein